jgi:hypothetical protein
MHAHHSVQRRTLLLLAGIGMGVMVATPPAFAVVDGVTQEGNVCMQKVFSGTSAVSSSNLLNCTANDIRLSNAISVTPSTCLEGTTFDLTATFKTDVTANARYDAAFFFRIDGGASARGTVSGGQVSGTCSATQLLLSQATAADGVLNLDGDTCGDLNAGSYNLTFTIPNVLCQAAPNTNPPVLKLPNCTSWHSNQGTACSLDATVNDANPDTKSKCVCDDNFTVPVLVEKGTIAATKDVKTGTPSSLPEPGGAFTYTISATNSSTIQAITLDRICDNRYGTIAKVADAPDCTAGTIGIIDGTTCSLSPAVVLQPGGSQNPPAANSSYSCEFTAKATGSVKTVQDTVTFYGHDGSSNLVQASDDATVSITDTPPTASVEKSLVGLACAEVNYKVLVTNTDTADDSITLNSLSDNTFGSLTSVHDDVLATTCGVSTSATPPGSGTLPATLTKSAPGNTYECAFTARFCANQHTNKVTAKVRDADNPTTDVSQNSNELTVNVSATVQ